MKARHVQKSLALLLVAALAACSGAGTSAVPAGQAQQTKRAALRPHQAILDKLVGVGDSLTAGYQSEGILGDARFPNPLDPPAYVPPGQENGWWADLWEQAQVAEGTSLDQAIDTIYSPGKSPLPLIAGPGLDNQIVATAQLFAPLKTDGCTAYGNFNQLAFSDSTWQQTRMNATTNNVRDFGVPGITLHEANVMNAPLTPYCGSGPLKGPAAGLSMLLNGESMMFYPMLGNYLFLGQDLTEVTAATSTQPSLATLWLGANDVIHYSESGGGFVGGDMTAAQASGDLRTAIGKLRRSGAQVVMANLPNVLGGAIYSRTDIPTNSSLCSVRQYLYCFFARFGASPTQAAGIVKELVTTYHLQPTSACEANNPLSTECGYLFLPGTLAVFQTELLCTKGPFECPLPNLDPTGPGSGLGVNYITPALATRIQTINSNINAGIDETAQSLHVPLVDVYSFFNGILSGDPKNPYFAQVSSINPGVCCTEVYLGGLASFDGLHPSNTGYALISYYWIKTLNAAYHTNIPEIDIKAAYNGTRCPKPLCFPGPYAPQVAGDLHLLPNGRGGLAMRYLR